jgi:hypothetical protein
MLGSLRCVAGLVLFVAGAWFQKYTFGGPLSVWEILVFTLPLLPAAFLVSVRLASTAPLTPAFVLSVVAGVLILSAIIGFAGSARIHDLIGHAWSTSDSPAAGVYAVVREYVVLYGPMGLIRSIGGGITLADGLRVITWTSPYWRKPIPETTDTPAT